LLAIQPLPQVKVQYSAQLPFITELNEGVNDRVNRVLDDSFTLSAASVQYRLWGELL
jgi:hypothetical protein